MNLKATTRQRALSLAVLALAFLTVRVAVWAQETTPKAGSAWAKKPMFSFRVGSFFSDLGGQIRIDGAEGQGTTIDLAEVLHLPSTATVIRGRADVRIATWFGIEAEFYRIARSKSTTLDRTITVGDEVFDINQELTSHLGQNYLDVSLKFFLLHGSRFDAGLWLGANVHFFDLSMDAQPSGRSAARKIWYPVPALGIHAAYTILPRLYLYGKAGYFKYGVSDSNIKFDAIRGDITLDYYIWKSLGLGVTYEYVKNTVDKASEKFMGTIQNRVSGVQVYAVIGF